MKNEVIYLYHQLAVMADAWKRCEDGKTLLGEDWGPRWKRRIEHLVRTYMPRGSGFDVGTEMVLYPFAKNRLTFKTAFHHMDENGCYDGWTDHVIQVKPHLVHRFELDIYGYNRNDIHDHISQAMNDALMKTFTREELDDIFTKLER